jgi:hypothetical protein
MKTHATLVLLLLLAIAGCALGLPCIAPDGFDLGPFTLSGTAYSLTTPDQSFTFEFNICGDIGTTCGFEGHAAVCMETGLEVEVRIGNTKNMTLSVVSQGSYNVNYLGDSGQSTNILLRCDPSQLQPSWRLTSGAPPTEVTNITGTSFRVCRPPSPPEDCIAADGRDLSFLASSGSYTASGDHEKFSFNLCRTVPCGGESDVSVCQDVGLLRKQSVGQLSSQTITRTTVGTNSGYLFSYNDQSQNSSSQVIVVCDKQANGPGIKWQVVESQTILGSTSELC